MPDSAPRPSRPASSPATNPCTSTAAPTNARFLGKLYDNILHRAPDAAGFAYWLDLLDKGQIGRDAALVNFAESHENQVAVIGTIQDGIDVPN